MNMYCNHAREVRLRWLGHKDEPRRVDCCEACAAMIWNRLPEPCRTSFVIESFDAAI